MASVSIDIIMSECYTATVRTAKVYSAQRDGGTLLVGDGDWRFYDTRR